MANVSVAQLAPFIATNGASAKVAPFAAGLSSGLAGSRLAGGVLGASGTLTVSGTTKSGGVAAARRVVLLTQPPAAKIIGEFATTAAANAFAFRYLPAGNYLVVDVTGDGSRRALVYDWVSAG
jgi:hypothetical protein